MLEEGLYTEKPGRATFNALAADKRVGIIDIFHFPRLTRTVWCMIVQSKEHFPVVG